MHALAQERETAIQSGLAALAGELREKGEVPGICIAVSTPDHDVEVQSGVREAGGQEPISGLTRFHIGCIAKLLLSLAALEKAQLNSLSFGTPIREFLPELSNSIHGRTVCLEHLLSHTAGYGNFPLTSQAIQQLTWDRFIARLVDRPQLFAPGTVFSYDHTGAVLVSEIIQRECGEGLAELLAAICDRLGVSPGLTQAGGMARDQAGRHTFDTLTGSFKPLSRTRASGSSASSAVSFWRPAFSNLTLSMKDLARIGRHLCGSVAELPEEPVLPPAIRSLIQKSVIQIPAFITARNARADMPEAFSLGAGRYEGAWHGISALVGGQCVALRYHPGLHVSVAVGINCARQNLLRYIARSACTVASGDPTPPPWRKPSISCAPAELEGNYRDGGDGSCDVYVKGDSLICAFAGASGSPGVDIEIEIGGDWPAVKRGIPGAAVSFFRTPGVQPIYGLMRGLVAYRRDDK